MKKKRQNNHKEIQDNKKDTKRHKITSETRPQRDTKWPTTLSKIKIQSWYFIVPWGTNAAVVPLRVWHCPFKVQVCTLQGTFWGFRFERYKTVPYAALWPSHCQSSGCCLSARRKYLLLLTHQHLALAVIHQHICRAALVERWLHLRDSYPPMTSSGRWIILEFQQLERSSVNSEVTLCEPGMSSLRKSDYLCWKLTSSPYPAWCTW